MKRDIQGKFTLKNDDHRQVRTLRLTDATWMALGMAAECLGLTRADLLEQVVRENNLTFPVGTGLNPSVSPSRGKYSEAVTRGKVALKFPAHVPSLPSN